ncbi:MAG: VWA domain-containing protein, partial [Planctomycetota bacterium]
AVFVIDDSFSMGQQVAAGPIYNAAADELAEQIRALRPGSQAAVVRASTGGDGELARLGPIDDPSGVAEQLRATPLSEAPTDLSDALDAARALLSGASGTRRCYVLGDFRRKDLAPPDRAAELREKFAALQDDGVDVVIADYGRKATANLTVEKIVRPDENALVLTGEAFDVEVTVRNHSAAASGPVTLRLTKRRPGEATRQAAPPVELPALGPGGAVTRRFEVTPGDAGPLVLRAAVPSDELPGDNAALLAVRVREAIGVLVVDDRAHAAPRERASRYFVEALAPRGKTGPCRVDRVTGAELAVTDLPDYDVVALLDVASLPATRGTTSDAGAASPVEAMEAFVRDGGGLVIFTGDRVDPRYYNEHLYAGGAGLLAYPIGPRSGDASNREDYIRLRVLDTPETRAAGGWLREYTKIGDFDLTSLVRVYAFTPATVPETPGRDDAGRPVVLARFDDPDTSPAVAVHPFGKGRVVSVFTTADRDWTDWPANELSYVPVINEMVRFLARPRENGRNGPVGQAIAHDVPQRLRRAEAVLEHSDGQVVARWQHAGEQVRHDAPRSGAYALRFMRGGRDVAVAAFARNVDPDEGDLAPGGRQSVAAVIGGEYVYTARDATGSPDVLLSDPQREYWTWALAAMLGLLAVETVLARRFGHYT